MLHIHRNFSFYNYFQTFFCTCYDCTNNNLILKICKDEIKYKETKYLKLRIFHLFSNLLFIILELLSYIREMNSIELNTAGRKYNQDRITRDMFAHKKCVTGL